MVRSQKNRQKDGSMNFQRKHPFKYGDESENWRIRPTGEFKNWRIRPTGEFVNVEEVDDINNKKHWAKNIKGSCLLCGLVCSRWNKCPAIGKRCRECKKIGHFAKVCPLITKSDKIPGYPKEVPPNKDNDFNGKGFNCDGRCQRSKCETKEVATQTSIDIGSEETEQKTNSHYHEKENFDQTKGNADFENQHKFSQSKKEAESQYQQENLKQAEEEARSLYRNKNYYLALSKYGKLIALSSNPENHYWNRSACYMMMGMYENALNDAKKSVEVNPKFIKGYARLVKIAMILGSFIEVETALAKLSKVDPKNELVRTGNENIRNVRSFIHLADESYSSQNYDHALIYINKVINICTHCITYKIKKGEYLALGGKYEDAILLAESILDQDKKNVDARYIMTICLYQSDLAKTLDDLKEILRLVPDHGKALDLYKKAKNLMEKKREGNDAYWDENYERAHTIYSEAIRIDPENKKMMVILYCNMAHASFHMGHVQKSIEECTKALAIDINCLKALMRRGQCYIDTKNYEGAIDDLSRAYDLSSGDNCRKMLEEAEKLWDRAEFDNYEMLGVEKWATLEEIRRAYREKALRLHPDRHSHASETLKRNNERKFKAVSRAYRILTNQ